MKLANSVKITVVLSTIILFISCKDNHFCEDIYCSAESKIIEVSIKDHDQKPVALDSFKVINIQNNSDITVPLSDSLFERARQSGQYPLVYGSSLRVNQQRQMRFIGYIDNKEVISSTYTVSKDCCNISLVSGDLNLTLNLNNSIANR